MKKVSISIITFVVFLFCFLLYMIIFSTPLSMEKIEEEAIPIREDEKIIGMDYYITINPYMKDNSIVISSRILDSVVHYKEPSLVHDFFVRLSINNQSKYDYLLKNIRIIDDSLNAFIEDLSYQKDNNTFLFYIPDHYLQQFKSCYNIQIEIEK